MKTSQKYQQLNKFYKPVFIPQPASKNIMAIAHDEAFNKPIANVFYNFSNN